MTVVGVLDGDETVVGTEVVEPPGGGGAAEPLPTVVVMGPLSIYTPDT